MYNSYEDWLAIQHLLSEYCRCLDLMDLDKLAACFTADCVVEYGPGTLMRSEGAAMLRASLRRMWRYRRTSHHLGNIQINFEGDGRASSTSYVLAWHEKDDGTQATLFGQYHDLHIMTPDGWRIAHRKLLMRGYQGDFLFNIYPLNRHPPETGWQPPTAAETGDKIPGDGGASR